MDEDQDRMYVGCKDHVLSMDINNITHGTLKVSSSEQSVKVLRGFSLQHQGNVQLIIACCDSIVSREWIQQDTDFICLTELQYDGVLTHNSLSVAYITSITFHPIYQGDKIMLISFSFPCMWQIMAEYMMLVIYTRTVMVVIKL